ncbi:MAG: ribosomal L7Ae/L30e/S12e/Gadd45 family protein [Clostridia bacterium]|nr:ribosomal L7Ae/L30e/S12e/Gadd45 family protein [Clostridia bacterium]
MNQRAMNMLGLCARAGKLVTGEKAVVQAIRSGSCHLALLDGAVAQNGEKAVTDACASHGVPLIKTGADALGAAIGRPGRMAAAVTDQGMAKRIIELSQPSGDR